MKVFAWNEKGEIDTVMTPYDSVRYYKYFAGRLSLLTILITDMSRHMSEVPISGISNGMRLHNRGNRSEVQ